jgi:hypothetical protein
MSENKRRKELQTVESLVSLMLHDPNLTRKEIINRMTGKGFPEENRPEKLNGISRQSVYKALDFLYEAGIIEEKSDKVVRITTHTKKINRYTANSITLSIDHANVTKNYIEMLIKEYMESDTVKVLPDNIKKIIFEKQKEYYVSWIELSSKEDNEIINQSVNNLEEEDIDKIEQYLHKKWSGNIMEYLRIFHKKSKANA